MDLYLEASLYLPDLNNERPQKNKTHYDNIVALNNLVLEYSLIDDIVWPGYDQHTAVNSTSYEKVSLVFIRALGH